MNIFVKVAALSVLGPLFLFSGRPAFAAEELGLVSFKDGLQYCQSRNLKLLSSQEANKAAYELATAYSQRTLKLKTPMSPANIPNFVVLYFNGEKDFGFAYANGMSPRQFNGLKPMKPYDSLDMNPAQAVNLSQNSVVFAACTDAGKAFTGVSEAESKNLKNQDSKGRLLPGSLVCATTRELSDVGYYKYISEHARGTDGPYRKILSESSCMLSTEEMSRVVFKRTGTTAGSRVGGVLLERLEANGKQVWVEQPAIVP